MNYDQAVQTLRSNPKAAVCHVTRDATLEFYVWNRVWLDEDGVLTQVHPTDRGTIAAPRDGRYELRASGLDGGDADPDAENYGEPHHGHGEGW